jgi:Fe-S-cluster containining protein
MECKIQCGECCKSLADTIRFCKEEIFRWQKEGRKDILRHIRVWCYDGEDVELRGDDPKIFDGSVKFIGAEWWKERIDICPFLEKDKCKIHDTKPIICCNYLCDKNGKTQIAIAKQEGAGTVQSSQVEEKGNQQR